MRRDQILKYGWTRQVVAEAAELPIPPNTNGVLVTNIGATLATVYGYPINAALVPGANGESWSIGGNYGEIIDMPGLDISFPNGAGLVFVQFKVYKNIC